MQRLSRVLPDRGLSRQLSFRTLLEAIGVGGFTTGSAFYFTHEVGLTAAQVGLGLTMAGLAASVTAVPLGRLTDRFSVNAGYGSPLRYSSQHFSSRGPTFMDSLDLLSSSSWPRRSIQHSTRLVARISSTLYPPKIACVQWRLSRSALISSLRRGSQ